MTTGSQMREDGRVPLELPSQRPSLSHETSWRRRRPAKLLEGLASGALEHHAIDATIEWPVVLSALGSVVLDQGDFVAADPYVSEANTPPFTERLKPGDHPLILAIAHIAEDHQRLAAGLLLGEMTPISRWTLALQPEQAIEDLEDDDSYYGFPVDAGTACIASPNAFAVASAVLTADGGMLQDPLSTALFSSTNQAALAAPAEGTQPVAILMTGWGDGVYPTWLGIDEVGNVSLAIVDFLLNADMPPRS